MEDVAVACNVSKGSLYNYFKNKNALIVAAFTALMEKKCYIFFRRKKTSDSTSDCLEKVLIFIPKFTQKFCQVFPQVIYYDC